MSADEIRKRVVDVFGYGATVTAQGDHSATVELRGFDEDSFTFDKLAELASVLGTKNINFGAEERDDGYCETCSSPYSVVVLRIKGICL